MRTDFEAEFLATPAGKRANEILRACVHCGFCNATCPTYQLTGDELDGPRGRIYLIRELLESGDNRERASAHLDRCLTCRACETTCPSGVAYGELAEIARHRLGPDRAGWVGTVRRGLRWVVPRPGWLRPLVRLGRALRWLLPRPLRDHLPSQVGSPLRLTAGRPAQTRGHVLLLNGCVQQVHTAATNEHLFALLQRHGFSAETVAAEACCGSLDLHLGATERALQLARQNVDAWYPRLAHVDAIVSTASGCGVTAQEYGRLLQDDPQYAARAAQVAACVVDIAPWLAQLGLELEAARTEQRVAWQAPCSLQHGQAVHGVVEQLLTDAGYHLTRVPDSHLCCGSAGTYSLLQPQLSGALKRQKLAALGSDAPQLVATANVGCQHHLATDCAVPVLHWIELLK